MQKDIIIPKVENVYVAAVQEWNDDFMENSWYAYLVNDNDTKLEMAIVVSRAYGQINGEDRKTGTFRHAFKEVEPNSAVKIELLENNVLQLNNEFLVTFFIGDKLYDKSYVFRANAINDRAMTDVPVMNKRGVLIK
ncbi:hypothetical protein FCR2A7T_19540 [Flavobacterium cauense R2A-7]|uniref:Phenylalanyl-tRNA synthetase subunit alpha n=1 Tax=Flavobacterium cauense R2A-7 TaxID=1341154 RepID=V6RZ88_9FLAO|nr:hypothetical protein [Flavobacterium cauense]ESU19342.1 hypothetical protein FCR2A7T_19540 [Flavobacterium cauense R2A-7]KGO80309.1 phenylalanyl-tRNA synthetase subunit alpha [Flavobacterium cauense R2A-7]TWI09311.1 hypothetical protein IP98_02472 [Flavobacterium cauense R2A-7]